MRRYAMGLQVVVLVCAGTASGYLWRAALQPRSAAAPELARNGRPAHPALVHPPALSRPRVEAQAKRLVQPREQAKRHSPAARSVARPNAKLAAVVATEQPVTEATSSPFSSKKPHAAKPSKPSHPSPAPVPPPPPPPAPAPPPPLPGAADANKAAEAARKAEHERQEQAEKAEHERQEQAKRAAEAAKKAEHERQEQAKRAAEAAKKAEHARQEQAKKAAKAAKKAEHERQEQAKQAAKRAAKDAKRAEQSKKHDHSKQHGHPKK